MNFYVLIEVTQENNFIQFYSNFIPARSRIILITDMLSGGSRPLIKIIFLPNFFTFTQMSTVNEQHSASIVLFYIFLTFKNK